MVQTLLLADDSITIQRVIELTFAEQGIKVVCVSDGQQAIEHLGAHRPDIALVGVSLQKLDGYEVAAFIQREPLLRGVPVLLLAGAFDTLDEARVRESGAAGVLIKPFEPRLVINRVKELLGISARQPTDDVALPQTGRLVTGGDSPAPRREEPVAPSPGAAAPPRREPAWDQLRHDTGLAADAAAVEGPATGGDDYFEQLDAAFDSLDAQLAGRAAPAGRATNPPPAPRYPAAMDPGGRRPAAPAEPTSVAVVAAPPPAPSMPTPQTGAPSPSPASSNPVFEVDDEWFPSDQTGEATQISGDAAPVPTFAPIPAHAASDAPAPGAPTAPVFAPAAPAAPVAPAAPAFAPAAPAFVPAAPITPVPPATPALAPAGMADAFALMLAQEQGEPMPEPELAPEPQHYHGGPVELSDEIIDRIAARVADRLMHGLLGETVTRTVNDVSERLVREEIARIRASASPKTP